MSECHSDMLLQDGALKCLLDSTETLQCVSKFRKALPRLTSHAKRVFTSAF